MARSRAVAWVAFGLLVGAVLGVVVWTAADPAPEPPLDPATPTGSTPGPERRTASSSAPASPATSPIIASEPAGASPRQGKRGEPDSGGPSLDDAPWPEVERRIAAAMDHARRVKGVFVAPGLLDRLRAEGRAHVVVGVAEGRGSLEPLLAATRHAGLDAFRVLPFARLEAGPQALERLLLAHDVGSVELRERLRPGLERTTVIVEADVARQLGADGAGTTIVVIDSGVDTHHPFFAGRLVDGHCFSSGGLCPEGGTIETDGVDAGEACAIPGCDHGTLVAGVALGDGAMRSGVAPAATLISIMAGSESEEGDVEFPSDDVALALEQVWLQRQEYEIAAVNLSIGSVDRPSHADCQVRNPSFSHAVRLLRKAGIAVVAASGNDGASNRISFPACLDGIVSVGATTKDDAVWASSNSASWLDLLAPGVDVATSSRGGGFAAATGTSIAAPHVAGAFAAARSVDPGYPVGDVLKALRLAGAPIEDARQGRTRPRIAIASAIDLLESGDLRSDSEKRFDEWIGAPSRCGLVGIELPWLGVAVRALHRRRRRAAAPRGGAGPQSA